MRENEACLQASSPPHSAEVTFANEAYSHTSLPGPQATSHPAPPDASVQSTAANLHEERPVQDGPRASGLVSVRDMQAS
jgi:hypothetical protein